MSSNIGKKLDGRYELIEHIGNGGMSDVYKARDVVEDQLVAVKILKKEYAENEEFLRRFRNESKAIKRLSHPNIVKIIDVGFSNKIQYIVMEYINGMTLDDYIADVKIVELNTASFFIVQILKALQHAHDSGIIHRDIKPQNIMLTNNGVIKVMDFGIAKLDREDQRGVAAAQAIGTVHYISPEQARSEETDEKSDIYSVGVVMYEMLTGKKPFDNPNPVTVALMHMQSKLTPPVEINPDISEDIQNIIMKAMEKNPDDRYHSARDMAAEIEKYTSFSDNFSDNCKKEERDQDMDNNKEATTTDNSENENTSENIANTKFFKAVKDDKAKKENKKQEKPKKPEKSEKPKKAEVVEEDSSTDDYEEEYVERRSMFVPILSGVVVVVLIIAVCFIFGMLYNYFGGGGSDTKEFQVQNFVGHQYDYVQKEYGTLLRFVKSGEEYSDQPEDTILWQELDEGSTVKPGTTIKVRVSLGEKKIKVKTIDSSYTEDQAISSLKDAGFEVLPKYMWSETVEKGYVVSTYPEANVLMKEGSTVTVYISRGPVTTEVRVPDLTGKKEAEAKDMLLEMDLVPIICARDSNLPEGTVVSQSHPGNTKVSTGTEITMFVSTGHPATVSQEIEIPFPANASGTFKFKYYIDGKYSGEDTGVNAAYTSKKTVSITSSGGVKDITITIVNEGNNKEAEIGRYKISFDEKMTKSVVSDTINDAFRKIDGIKENITPVVTTTAPVETQPVETTTEEPVQTEPQPTEITEEEEPVETEAQETPEE